MQISTKPAHLPRSCVYDFSLLTLSLFFLEAELFKSLLFCLPLFLLVGPFAPPSITGTDVRVDRGEVVNFPDREPELNEDTNMKSSQWQRRPEEATTIGPVVFISAVEKWKESDGIEKCVMMMEEEKEWSEEDL